MTDLSKPEPGSGRMERFTRRLAARKATDAAIKAAQRQQFDDFADVKDAVFARDRGLDRAFNTPVVRRGLSPLDDTAHFHHVVHKSQGGDDSPENLILISSHTHDLIHKLGVLECEGDANEVITFRLYKYESGSRNLLRVWESSVER
jgi:hypothetical protein